MTFRDKARDGTTRLTGAPGSAPAFAGVKVYRSASYSLANAAVTSIPWDAEEWDTDGFHDNATNNNRLTVPTGLAGKYTCKVNVGVDVNGVTYSRFLIGLQKNGAAIRGGNIEFGVSNSSTYPMGAVTCDVDLAVGDYVDSFYFQDSGSGRNLYNAKCAFSMYKIG
jgi:hypothetical protein